jgi:hypothetical protein
MFGVVERKMRKTFFSVILSFYCFMRQAWEWLVVDGGSWSNRI